MPSTTSTTPATSSSHLPLDGFARVRHLFNPWEEPHPGKRLPVTTEASNDYEKIVRTGSQHVTGGYKDGMAAKELNPYHHTRPWLVRRPIRVRSRANAPGPLKITTEISEDADAKSTLVPAVHNLGIPSPAMATPAIPPVVPEDEGEKAAAQIADTPGDTEVQPSGLPLPVSPPIDCQFTDFSNLLGISVQSAPEEEETAVAVANSETDSYCHAAPDEDIYGWDADFERQI
ncbi:hypothetical protein EsH8_II_000910 [Colletotrichum jinshuiense]